jgi:hypothetical protein
MALQKRSVVGTAADPTLQFADLEIDDKTYKLAYSFQAIAEAEHLAGCNLLSGLDNLQELSARQLRGLFFAALSIAQPKITIEQSTALIRLDTTYSIRLALAKAYNLSIPDKSTDPPEADPPADVKS